MEHRPRKAARIEQRQVEREAVWTATNMIIGWSYTSPFPREHHDALCPKCWILVLLGSYPLVLSCGMEMFTLSHYILHVYNLLLILAHRQKFVYSLRCVIGLELLAS